MFMLDYLDARHAATAGARAQAARLRELPSMEA